MRRSIACTTSGCTRLTGVKYTRPRQSLKRTTVVTRTTAAAASTPTPQRNVRCSSANSMQRLFALDPPHVEHAARRGSQPEKRRERHAHAHRAPSPTRAPHDGENSVSAHTRGSSVVRRRLGDQDHVAVVEPVDTVERQAAEAPPDALGSRRSSASLRTR